MDMDIELFSWSEASPIFCVKTILMAVLCLCLCGVQAARGQGTLPPGALFADDFSRTTNNGASVSPWTPRQASPYWRITNGVMTGTSTASSSQEYEDCYFPTNYSNF